MKKRGFTLIEILIAFSILVLLAIIGFIAWQNQTAKARDARRKADLQRLTTAFEDYYGDAETYPPAGILTDCGAADHDQLKPYLDQPIPCDPLTHTPYCYVYDSNPPIGQEFRILAALENDLDSDIGRLGCGGPDFCGYDPECAAFGSGFNYGFSSTNIAVLNPNTPFDPGGSPAPSPSGGPAPSPSASPSPTPSASPLPSASPYPSPHPYDETNGYIYACQGSNGCNSWGYNVPGCYFFTNNNCDNMCLDSHYWCYGY